MDDLGFTPDPPEAEPKSFPVEQSSDPSSAAPKDDGIGFVAEGSAKPHDDGLGFTPDESQTSTIGATLEGAAKGLAGPIATGAELGLSKLGVPGLSAQEQAQREAEHPIAEGVAQAATLAGSAFIPFLGEYTLGSAAMKAAGATAKATELGRIGSMALTGAIESGLFQTSDEASKYLIGQSDPEAPVSSALAHIGAATLLGGGGGALIGKVGSKLEQIAEGKAGSAAGQFLADFGNRFNFLQKNPDTVSAATDEAQHMFDTVSAATQSGFGLKRKSIDELTANLTPDDVSNHIQQVADWVNGADKELTGDRLFQKEYEKWQQAVFPGAEGKLPSAGDVFEASDNFKRQLQEWGQYNKKMAPLSEQPFRNAARGMADNLKTNLENPDVWGDMGTFQQKLNAAYSEMQAPLKDFVSSAVSKKEGVADTVDPAKIGSIFRSVVKDKPLTGFRDAKVRDFFPAARNFLETVDDLHAGMGLESNIPKVSTNVLDEMLNGDVSRGKKFADWLFGAGPGAIGRLSAHVAGTVAGHAAAPIGGPAAIYTGYRMAEHAAPALSEGIGRRLTRWGVAGVLRALSAGDTEGMQHAIHYSETIGKGARKINDAVSNVFATGGQQSLNSKFNEKDREKLKNYIENGSFNQQIQNQSAPTSPQQGINPQGFAHGGMVLAPEPAQPVAKPVGKPFDNMGKVSTAFPEQSMLLGAAKGRINNYLNSIRPQAVQSKLPFDDAMPNKEHDRSYEKALNIANSPLSVLDHIKKGTLEPEHVQHAQQLYPELSNHLRKKLTDGITKAQAENKKPPHHVMQSLSLFMGAALDSTLTPAGIQAAQSTFMSQKGTVQPGGGKLKGSTQKMDKIAPPYQTRDQAAAARQIVKD